MEREDGIRRASLDRMDQQHVVQRRSPQGQAEQKEQEQDSKSRSQGAYGLYMHENSTEPDQPSLIPCEQNTKFLCLLCGLARMYN